MFHLFGKDTYCRKRRFRIELPIGSQNPTRDGRRRSQSGLHFAAFFVMLMLDIGSLMRMGAFNTTTSLLRLRLLPPFGTCTVRVVTVRYNREKRLTYVRTLGSDTHLEGVVGPFLI
jgi:hypothetical protein